MTLATRNAGHRCMWVVSLRGVPASVGLAHSVAITPVLLFLSELSAVALYYDTAVCNKKVRVGGPTGMLIKATHRG
jgi:hypothetical protein